MKRTRFLPMLILTTALAASSAPLLSAQNRIVAAPDAVELRKVWEREGRWGLDAEYGWRMWGGTDISGDGIADFAVYQREGEYANTWHFYRGGDPLDTAAFWRTDSSWSLEPVIGDFFGNDSLYMLLIHSRREVTDTAIWDWQFLRLNRLSDTGLVSTPLLYKDFRMNAPPTQVYWSKAVVLDLNRDSSDDLIFQINGVRYADRKNNYDLRGQIWIYYGGPDFQLDSPSVIIYDTLDSGGTAENFGAFLIDVNGDSLTDLLSSGVYTGGIGGAVRIWFGDQNSPESWSRRQADRTIITHAQAGTSGLREYPKLGLYQLDTHPGIDLVGILETADEQYTAYIYLSSRDTVATRSFLKEDADLQYELPPRYRFSGSAGFLSDQKRRVEMLPLLKPPFFGGDEGMIYLSGGSQGPDADYDAYLRRSVFGYSLGDVTGDGWEDYGGADPYLGVLDEGIATIYAGGPYIPLDDPTLSVREVPVVGESGGLYLWPNPVDDELSIAWRGDLRRMPARFEVYDARGAVVAEGEVEPWRGKALWLCANVPAGRYTLVAYAQNGAQIAAAPVAVR